MIRGRIFICGDSTAASYNAAETPIVGWGQLLPAYLPETVIVNRSIAGRSTKSFLAEGRLRALEEELAPGDALLIQFAHNDEGNKPERHTEPWADYRDNLKVFIETARKHGALPVLVTPICIRLWENGALRPTHGEYLKAMRYTAEETRTAMIDLYEDTFRIVAGMGGEKSKDLYMNLRPGDDPRYPDGLKDNTHTRYAGADLYAKCMAEHLKTL
ncbi:MAG: rhamnogalacturonan acetylesterase [Clostridia bacterium]|nr:rhamnogalacturonan acetylesterase [Clostridia bacterium]